MIRTLLEYQIQRYLDDGLPLPGWLTMLVRRDRKLQEFVDEFHALDDALLLSAAARRDALTAGTTTMPALHRHTASSWSIATHRHPGLSWAYGGVAAAAMLVIAVTMAAPRQNTEAEAIQAITHRFTEMPSDVGNLLTRAADSSQARLSRYSPAALIVPDRAAWRSTASHIVEPLDRPARLVSAYFSKYSDLSERLQAQDWLD